MTESDFRAFEVVGALVAVLDPDGRIVYWNHRCSDLTGYSLEEVRGRRLWDFALVPEEVEPVKAVFATLLTAERPSAYANYWVTKTGERRWIAWSHTSTRSSDGRFEYVVNTGIDRTESRQALDALRASGAKLDASFAETRRLYEEALRAAADVLVKAHGEGSEAVVEIVNQGDPIPAELLPVIFEPFRQARRERSTKGNLGLGLYIAKQIVLTSGGTLDVRTADGTTAFVIRLPRNRRAVIPSSSRAAAHG